MKRSKILFVSTPVAALGDGTGGGVELTVTNMTQVLQQRGHQVHVLAPIGSKLPNDDIRVIEIDGTPQPSIQALGRDSYVTLPCDSLLENMWAYVRSHQQDYDLIVNVAYDWLPFYLTAFLPRPVAHLVSMGSLTDAMDQIIAKVAAQFPGSISVYTKTQAQTFDNGDRFFPIGFGLDLSLYEYCDRPQKQLCWMGRISPEKAIEDAVDAAHQCQMPLQVMGKLQDAEYFQGVTESFPAEALDYLGFKSTQDMQKVLRTCEALVATPRWVEAFGIVMIEALACGVPVIAYSRGGPTEIVRSGTTGFLVEPDSVKGLVAAIKQLPQLDRRDCRRQAEQNHSLETLGDRIEQWLAQTLNNWSP
ncbi:MAG: glycosyltransferase family 4 protein [Cyanobacteria bacterium P01_F01_bin.42]